MGEEKNVVEGKGKRKRKKSHETRGSHFNPILKGEFFCLRIDRVHLNESEVRRTMTNQVLSKHQLFLRSDENCNEQVILITSAI